MLADFTGLVGVGVRKSDGVLGQLWSSERVATDDARVVRVVGTRLECRGLDGFDAPFEVDAISGKIVSEARGRTRRPPLFSFLGRKD